MREVETLGKHSWHKPDATQEAKLNTLNRETQDFQNKKGNLERRHHELDKHETRRQSVMKHMTDWRETWEETRETQAQTGKENKET